MTETIMAADCGYITGDVMNFVHFTSPSGAMVRVMPDGVKRIYEPLKGEMAPGVRTVLVLDGGIQGVKETIDVVEAKLA